MKKARTAAKAAHEATARKASGEIADKDLDQASGGSFSFGASTAEVINAIGKALSTAARSL